MLSQRSEELETFFAEGREFAGFASPEEMYDKARYYLEHDNERRLMAERGYLRLQAGKHTIADRVNKIIELIEQR